jgi:hypothetical protein
MWKHGACLAAVAGVLLACSGGDGGGGKWYKQKPIPSAGAAGIGNESAGQSGAGTGERPSDSVGAGGSATEEQ